MALLGGQAEPFENLMIIDTCLIAIAKFYLGEEIFLLACFMEPDQRFFRGARGLQQSTQIKLGEVIPLAGRTPSDTSPSPRADSSHSPCHNRKANRASSALQHNPDWRIGLATGRLLHILSVQKNTGLFYKDLRRLVQNPGMCLPENVSHAGGPGLRHCKTIAGLFSVPGQPLHHNSKESPI